MQINGVIFDLDGTLGDSLYVAVESIVRAVKATTGQAYTHPQVIDHFGPTEQGMIRQLIPQEHWEESYRIFLQEYEALHQNGQNGVFPGIPQLIEMLHDHGLHTAIVTGKGQKPAEISLRHFGLENTFDTVETGDLHQSGKEDRINKVLAQWQIPGDEVIYIGDAVSDVAIARRAGVVPVSVAWAGTHTVEELAAAQPHRLFTRVDDLQAWLAGQLNGTSAKGA